MLSFFTTHMHTHISKSHDPSSRLHFPLIPRRIFTQNPQNKAERFHRRSGFTAVKTRRKIDGNFGDFCCWCKRIERDVELEEEIMEFMEKSEKPMMFPTKVELLKGGRMDLVEAIKKRGGWYFLGWDEENVGDHTVDELEFDIAEIQRRVDSDCVETASLREEECNNSQLGSNSWMMDGSVPNQIQTRLHSLEVELSTALHSLRSKREECQEKVIRSSSDLEKPSDAWEFKENEFMTAQERLRSIRAKLPLLERKMALAISDAEKLVEEKQKLINNAHKAFKLLRAVCIVCPVSASEVLLAGSFDGWTTKRKMEKSSAGIFSVKLKLYPGRYEIKFIVDGKWKVDPLHPIINNNGYKNNLLVVT